MLRPEAIVRASKYLNNLIEQEHRRVKQCSYPMPGFKKSADAATAISGIELVRKIKKVAVRYRYADELGRRASAAGEGSGT